MRAHTSAGLTALFSSIHIHSTSAFYPLPDHPPPNETHPSPSPRWTKTFDYSGANFFNNFQFFTDKDPTNGHVQYTSLTDANSTSLAGFLKSLDTNTTSNATGPIYLGVDSTSPSPQGRRSVRVNSVQKLNPPFLVVADILHMPAPVCGTWPAFWLLGSSDTAPWPEAGEIDILENVNDAQANGYTLHTSAGFVAENHTAAEMKGRLVTGNCDVNAQGQEKNVGCGIVDGQETKSYGDGFNDNNGGVFATLVDELGVRIWFFPRDKLPADITAHQPVPPCWNMTGGGALEPRHDGEQPMPIHMPNGTESTWDIPSAIFTSPDNGADGMKRHFRDMQIIFNTAFCGDWAGKVWESSPTCKALAPTCQDFVSNHPKEFEEVYWAINGVRVFQPGRERLSLNMDTGNLTVVSPVPPLAVLQG